MRPDDELETYFQEGADQFNQSPPAHVWEGIAAGMPKSVPWYARPWLFRRLLGLVLLLLLVWWGRQHYLLVHRVDGLRSALDSTQQREEHWAVRWDSLMQALPASEGEAFHRSADSLPTAVGTPRPATASPSGATLASRRGKTSSPRDRGGARPPSTAPRPETEEAAPNAQGIEGVSNTPSQRGSHLILPLVSARPHGSWAVPGAYATGFLSFEPSPYPNHPAPAEWQQWQGLRLQALGSRGDLQYTQQLKTELGFAMQWRKRRWALGTGLQVGLFTYQYADSVPGVAAIDPDLLPLRELEPGYRQVGVYYSVPLEVSLTLNPNQRQITYVGLGTSAYYLHEQQYFNPDGTALQVPGRTLGLGPVQAFVGTLIPLDKQGSQYLDLRLMGEATLQSYGVEGIRYTQLGGQATWWWPQERR